MSAVAAAVMPHLEAEGRVALDGVDFRARLRDLLCEVTTTQTYRNLEAVPIEAVYTFPLPLGATLLELTLTLGERVLKGTVVGRSAAERRYEDAITDGDAAILLTESGPGLYTLNVGNLLPGEKAVIRFTYALLQDWQDGSLRLRLPTTLAPRYGDALAAGLRPHEVPETTLTGENLFTLEVTLEGLLARAALDCPSHRVVVTPGEKSTRVALSGGRSLMDRDFVLNLRLEGAERASARADRDLDGHVAYASFNPVFPSGQDTGARSVKVVVDCSGSMGGDSIAQARVALARILGSLRPQDSFNVVLFGSHQRALFPLQVPADAEHLGAAREVLDRLDADMGGTELGAALAAAYALRSPPGLPQDVLLITDGEVWEVDTLVEAARRSGHRVFTVGVGSAVSEATVRGLAEATGGACELVTPNEDMAERVHRHFKRLLLLRATHARVRWPVEPTECLPETLEAVYDGDTVHVFARFPEPPTGEAVLEVTLADGRTLTQRAVLRPAPAAEAGEGPSTLARLARARELKALTDAEAGAALAVCYQLMSPWTGYVVVAERAEGERAGDLPALRKVPHMLAAGWGGTGVVQSLEGPEPRACLALPCEDVEPVPEPCPSMDIVDISVFLRHDLEASREPPLKRKEDWLPRAAAAPAPRGSLRAPFGRSGVPSVGSLTALVEALNRASSLGSHGAPLVATVGELEALGAEDAVVEVLRELVAGGRDERVVVVVFLHILAEGPAGAGLSRDARRSIVKAYKTLSSDPAVLAGIRLDLIRKLPPTVLGAPTRALARSVDSP